MMKLYSIKDNKVGFWKPFVCHNDAVASREFGNMINFRGSSGDFFVQENYCDLDLYCLGTYDENTGVITPDVQFICSGVSLKKEV